MCHERLRDAKYRNRPLLPSKAKPIDVFGSGPGIELARGATAPPSRRRSSAPRLGCCAPLQVSMPPPYLQVGMGGGANDKDELPRPSAVNAASPITPRPGILAPAVVSPSNSDLAEAIEKPMPAISLLLSAAKQHSFSGPRSSNGQPRPRYSLDNLAGSAPASSDLVATDPKARLRRFGLRRWARTSPRKNHAKRGTPVPPTGVPQGYPCRPDRGTPVWDV